MELRTSVNLLPLEKERLVKKAVIGSSLSINFRWSNIPRLFTYFSYELEWLAIALSSPNVFFRYG